MIQTQLTEFTKDFKLLVILISWVHGASSHVAFSFLDVLLSLIQNERQLMLQLA